MSNDNREWDGEGQVADLPLLYERAVIVKFYVEFIDVGPTIERRELHKNHVLLRVTFAQPIGDDLGARISMDVEDPFSGSKKGSMNVKIIPFDEPSRRAVICFSFPLLRNGITLGELLEVATSKGMQYFQFITIGDDNPMGCRDFITQYCHQIQAAGLVGRTTTDPFDGSQKALNDIIPFRYSPVTNRPPRRDPSRIDKGIFTSGAYVRVENDDMDYRP